VQPQEVDPPVREALARALEDLGCPAHTAVEIADDARVEWQGPTFGEPGAWMLMLETPAAHRGIEYPTEPDEVEGTVQPLAENVAADNAEAWDRTARGEQGWTTLWPLPDRRPRR